MEGAVLRLAAPLSGGPREGKATVLASVEVVHTKRAPREESLDALVWVVTKLALEAAAYGSRSGAKALSP